MGSHQLRCATWPSLARSLERMEGMHNMQRHRSHSHLPLSNMTVSSQPSSSAVAPGRATNFGSNANCLNPGRHKLTRPVCVSTCRQRRGAGGWSSLQNDLSRGACAGAASQAAGSPSQCQFELYPSQRCCGSHKQSGAAVPAVSNRQGWWVPMLLRCSGKRSSVPTCVPATYTGWLSKCTGLSSSSCLPRLSH